MPHYDLNSFLQGMACLWFLAAIAHALPKPRREERWYGAFYKLVQFAHSNFALMKAGKPPATPTEEEAGE